MSKTLPSILRYRRFYILSGLLIFGIFLYSMLSFKYPNSILEHHLCKNAWNLKPAFNAYDTLDRHIQYVEMGNDKKPLVVFIHGAPASASFWLSYMTDSLLLSRFKMMAIDRPGYGESGFGQSEPSVARQAKIISKILRIKRKLHDVVILHGSSYGGALTARLAMDYPNLMDGIILQSASVAPGLEKTYSISYPTSKAPLKWLIPQALRMANEEKLNHRKTLEAMLPFWKRIKVPAIILHGTKDGLIYPENAEFAKTKMVNAPWVELIWAKGRGHDLAWTRRGLILESIQKLSDRILQEKE